MATSSNNASTEMLTALRELTTTKQLDRTELLDLIKDGIHAALAKRFGANVKFDLTLDEMTGTMV
ncbi:MAG: hypothetical protein JF590_08455, partial [Gemmatimonadetes bacterium]|nr:hypothetical protein [Gemmatimonadota bacterium]